MPVALHIATTRSAGSSTPSPRSARLDNTLVIYIQGDNGASAEGSRQGLLNEMTFFNKLKETFDEVLRRMDELGGPMTFNHYPIGWAHAMDTPFQWTKQVASITAARRTAWSSPGQSASRRTARCARSCPRHRHHADRSRGRRPPGALLGLRHASKTRSKA